MTVAEPRSSPDPRQGGGVRTLVLHARYGRHASYYDDWLEAFEQAPQFATSTLDIVPSRNRARLPALVREAELVVLLHSTNADSMFYLSRCLGPLQDRAGRLLSFVGNEVNLPGSVMGDKIAFLAEVGADYVATQLPIEAGRYLYGHLPGRVVAVPHALNDTVFRPLTDTASRPVEVGGRSWRYYAYLGDDDRNRLFDLFAANPFEPPLRLDLSTEHRFDREGWAAFLNRCQGTISTEAGSFFLEKDDSTVREIREYLRSTRKGIEIPIDSPLQRLGHVLPFGLKQRLRALLRHGAVRHEGAANEEQDFAEIYERFFRDRPRPPVYSKCISSRHFDAIGTKTLQVMIRGRFNDILEADRHYVGLEADLSDADDAVARLRDEGLRRTMTDEAYEYVRSEHTYRRRLRDLAEVLGA